MRKITRSTEIAIGAVGRTTRFALVAVILANGALARCPPILEGTMPQKTIVQYKPNAQKRSIPKEQLLAAVGPSVSVVSDVRRRVNENVHLPAQAAVPVRPRIGPMNAVPQQVAFPGPVSIRVPGAGKTSTIVEQDGKFLVVGGSDTDGGQVNDQGISVSRLEADGTLDPSFGQVGSVRIGIYAGSNIANNSPVSVALSPTGKIVVSRTISDLFPGNIPGHRVVVVRLEKHGTLDTTFGSGGFVFTTLDNELSSSAVAVQRDDRIVVAGSSGHHGSCLEVPCTNFGTLIRYLPSGQLDADFGASGVVRAMLLMGSPPFLANSSFSAVSVQENGLIVVVGEVETVPLNRASKMLVVEYLPTGEMNPSFGNAGIIALDFGGPHQETVAASLALQENGKIVVGGTATLWFRNSGGGHVIDDDFVAARLTAGGELDGAFGNSGKIIVDVNPRSAASARPHDSLNKLLLSPSGELYAVGTATSPLSSAVDKAVNIVKLNSNGSLNDSFGKLGLYSSGTYNPWQIWLGDDALLTADGRLLVAGTHRPRPNEPDAFVVWAYSIYPKPPQLPCN